MAPFAPILFIVIMVSCSGQQQQQLSGWPTDAYCARSYPRLQCCSGRADHCSMTIGVTKCYCDDFCDDHKKNDCCPDYESHCLGHLQVTSGSSGPQKQIVTNECYYNGTRYTLGQTVYFPKQCCTCTCKVVEKTGTAAMECFYKCQEVPLQKSGCFHEPTSKYYKFGQVFKDLCQICVCTIGDYSLDTGKVLCYPPNCGTTPATLQPPPLGCTFGSQFYAVGTHVPKHGQICTCVQVASNRAEMRCAARIIHIKDRIKPEEHGWSTFDYPWLNGANLDDVYRRRTGLCRPDPAALVKMPVVHSHQPPATFDARMQWPGWITLLTDQRDLPISWAITIAAVASDRTAIKTCGCQQQRLSVQNLVSCVSHQGNCQNSTSGWRHLNQYGIVGECCYPLTYATFGRCPIPRGLSTYTARCPKGPTHGIIFRLPPHYKVGETEAEIMREICVNGPVQAHIRVRDDFLYYRSGVYKHVFSENRNDHHSHYLAVRILGWGMDTSTGQPIKYWLCANSWSSQWGESGYFRILRGANELDIERYVYSVWSAVNGEFEPEPTLEPVPPVV